LTTWGFPTPHSKSTNGIAVYTARTAKALTQLGHQVTVITSDAEGMPIEYEQDGIAIYQAKPGNIHWYLYKLGVQTSIIRLVKLYDIGSSLVRRTAQLQPSRKFDLIEVGPPSNYFFPYLRKDSSPNVITTIHGMTSEKKAKNDSFSQRLDRYIEMKSALLSRHLIAPSQFVSDSYRTKYNVLPQVIPHPIDFIDTGTRPETPIKVVTLAGIGSDKGSDFVLNSMTELLKKHTNLQIWFVAAEGKPDFINFAQAFKPTGQVELLPWLPLYKMLTLYANSHIFISASSFETFGLAAAEAMAAGMAVLLSDIPSHIELIGNSERGITFQLSNPRTFEKALEELVSNTLLRKQMGKTARDWALTHLDPVTVTKKRLDFYQSTFNH
jgi:glycosyltransferase involved in cell wall biosynthesis